jgi:hypothetical protein
MAGQDKNARGGRWPGYSGAADRRAAVQTSMTTAQTSMTTALGSVKTMAPRLL